MAGGRCVGYEVGEGIPGQCHFKQTTNTVAEELKETVKVEQRERDRYREKGETVGETERGKEREEGAAVKQARNPIT